MLNVQDDLVYFNVMYMGSNEIYGVTRESFFAAIEEHLKNKPICIVSNTQKNHKTHAEAMCVDLNDVILIAKEFKDGKIGVLRNFNKLSFDLDELSKSAILDTKYTIDPETKEIKIISFITILI